MTPAPQPKCLVIDLEVLPEEPNRAAKIFMIGALRPDTGEELELKVKNQLSEALERLDEMAEGASFLLGHNLIAHDLPLLREAAPHLKLLSLPVIDTLRLSPLAFPQNPYHRLIKDYKLIRDSLNSPLADCKSTLTLFQDQHQAFANLAENHPEELTCYQALATNQVGAGLGNFFLAMSGKPPVGRERLREILPTLVRETDPSLVRDLKVCRTRLSTLVKTDLGDADMYWPIAYALAWLRVSGGNSVLAPWVRYQFPAVTQLIKELRDIPCSDNDCQYCKSVHDPRQELKHYFNFDDFRYEADGNSAQFNIVLAGMQGKSVLAVLATGGGKSICYQLPALNRYHRNGSLTIIISPLQSLMKDQVDGMIASNIHCAAALNGLLTMPERAEALEKIQMGDIGILLVSPEQFRNKAFRKAIKNRQIGAWIFDEAHCLSKWGNDFRPDYLYAARFIREFSENEPVAPIGCFTATAKQDVLEDIQQHFKQELGITFEMFIGSPERNNLSFEVLPTVTSEKWQRTHLLLEDELSHQEGGAVVFVSSRKNAEELAEFLIQQAWACRFFHAGLQPPETRDIQDDFKAGQLRVIVATNAFGMGVDKPDVRLVVHANIPGSLENYLQEAGRAGRDQHQAKCVLLYDPQDIETQFGLTEKSKLSLQDLQQVLRKLRFEATRRKGGELVITAGEILQDESVDTSFEADDRDAETKVVTAIAWLERGQYLSREENHTKIFPARLCLTEADAQAKLLKANLPERRIEEFRAVLNFLYSADADERINTDQLMLLTGQNQEEMTSTLKQLENLGLLENDSQLTIYLRHGVSGSSTERLMHSVQLEEALFNELRVQAPDADQGGWQDINLRLLSAELREITGQLQLLPIHLSRLLRNLAQDRDGDSAQRSSFELRHLQSDHFKLRIREGYSWDQVQRQGDSRRAIAAVLMPFLIAKLPNSAKGKDLLVQTTFGELVKMIEGDLHLRHTIKLDQRKRAIEHVLLYLHQQEIVTLNHGMTVMRRAMSIEINPEKTGQRYLKEDFSKLDEHYREKRIQVHVMREYAEIALKEMAEALRLVMHYFSDHKQEFLKLYFSGKEEVLKLATSEASWRSIIDGLNTTQKLIVTDPDDRNRLILAGPGSGKTRVIVHRIAYLLRVKRMPASSIIALTFNRHAANEIRRRLIKLVGADAYGLTILTYHAMAMRLTGVSFAQREKLEDGELDSLLEKAAELLDGKLLAEGEDDLREKLLRGYRYILVDEYQDIDNRQYNLVSALAKRHNENDDDLCILAVGDDDQNIYQWRGGSNEYIERYREEYGADISYLVENFRSSELIIAAANSLIEQNHSRLKAEHPIRINKARGKNAAGGEWQSLDESRKGRVLCLRMPSSDSQTGNLQAQAVLAELLRLKALDESLEWRDFAILTREHRYLLPIQAWCEQQAVPYFLASDKSSALPITRQRAYIQVIEHLRKSSAHLLDAGTAFSSLESLSLDAQWHAFFLTAFEQLIGEFGECQLSNTSVIDWLYDYAREMRQQPQDGIYLGTVHSAKGLEFPHVTVLDGGWRGAQQEAERRLYYVGMTRAMDTLTLCEFEQSNIFTKSLSGVTQLQSFNGYHDPALEIQYLTLSMKDIDIGYPGRQPATAEIHNAVRHLQPGDPLELIPENGQFILKDAEGRIVGRTAKSFQLGIQSEKTEVAAIITRYLDDSDESYRSAYKCDQWEIVIPRLRGYLATSDSK